ncbi:MAG TPA: pantoate--beta-alanine ligase [Dongiaceae bacterium]|jgi:pantoate--beta-alanine ligase|nr:pantoate--beta-alanine ligase [Dongiaceae bacterium]
MLKIDVVRSVAALRAVVRPQKRDGRRIGLVPTMGALHQGHLELVKTARRMSDFVIASIFVNPLQFNQSTDLAAYPRDEATDLNLLAATGTDLVFAPSTAEMYPQGFSTQVKVAGLTDHLDGPARPGHFEGVATVVTKLFNQVEPDLACFGEKDFQQLQVIRRMTRDLDLPIEIVGVPTVREPDGLAMSSRNRNLSAAERGIAARLPDILGRAIQRLADGGRAAPVLEDARAALRNAGFDRIDYVELCDGETLHPLAAAEPGSRLFAAAHVGATRLIDNWPVLP